MKSVIFVFKGIIGRGVNKDCRGRDHLFPPAGLAIEVFIMVLAYIADAASRCSRNRKKRFFLSLDAFFRSQFFIFNGRDDKLEPFMKGEFQLFNRLKDPVFVYGLNGFCHL